MPVLIGNGFAPSVRVFDPVPALADGRRLWIGLDVVTPTTLASTRCGLEIVCLLDCLTCKSSPLPWGRLPWKGPVNIRRQPWSCCFLCRGLSPGMAGSVAHHPSVVILRVQSLPGNRIFLLFCFPFQVISRYYCLFAPSSDI